MIQIASIPEREKLLERTLRSLHGQDEITVMLNGYRTAPAFINELTVNYRITDNRMGDAHKFQGVEGLEGYIFTCDDDLIYPKDYISELKKGVDKYGVASFHGRTMNKRPVEDYYKKGRDFQFRCLYDVDKDVMVDVVGTGVLGWHTDSLKINFSHFLTRNMADIWFSAMCRSQGVDMWVINHKAFWIEQQPCTGIFEQEFGNDEIQTSLYNDPLNFVNEFYLKGI